MGIVNVAKKFKESKTLLDFFSKVLDLKDISTDDDNTTLLDQVEPNLPFAKLFKQLQNKMRTKDNN